VEEELKKHLGSICTHVKGSIEKKVILIPSFSLLAHRCDSLNSFSLSELNYRTIQ